MVWLLCTAAPAYAAISDNVNTDGPNGDPYPAELSLVIWDKVREASYTLDLGIRVDEFSVQGQSDLGMQRFWSLNVATDSAFAKLRRLGTAISSLQWAIIGIDADGFGLPGDFNAFLTLQQAPVDGVLNPNYANLRAITNIEFNNAVGLVQTNLVLPLNQDRENPNNTHSSDTRAQFNGVSFTAKGQLGYFGIDGVLLNTFGPGANTSIMNTVGKSSWFYHLLASSFDPFDPIAVDEFDNLSADGYWGLAENPADGTFALSYTLGPIGLSAAQLRFVASIGRTEFNGGFLSNALPGVAAAVAEQSFGAGPSLPLGAAVTTPVPEPASLALMAAGLALVAAIARRRRS